MPTSVSIEDLPNLIKRPTFNQVTIVVDNPFLSFFAEKTLKDHLRFKHRCHITKHEYTTQNHLAIQTALLSQDMFSDSQAHILTIKGVDLKQEKLATLIKATVHIPIIFVLEKLTPAQKKTKGYTALSHQTTSVLTKTLSAKKTALWLQNLLNSQKIRIPSALITPVCQSLDWDPSSIAQLVEQMKQQELFEAHSLDCLKPLMLTTHQAPIFTLFENIFKGNTSECRRFFQTYHQQDIIQKIYWMSIKRLRQFIQLQERMLMNNLSVHHIIEQEKIWTQLKPQYERALSMPRKKLHYCYLKLCTLEWMIKGKIKQNFNDTAVYTLMHICKAFQ